MLKLWFTWQNRAKLENYTQFLNKHVVEESLRLHRLNALFKWVVGYKWQKRKKTWEQHDLIVWTCFKGRKHRKKCYKVIVEQCIPLQLHGP